MAAKKEEDEIDENEDEEKSLDMIDKANEAAERLEKATTDLNKSLAKQEAIQVKQTLAGTTDAGQPEEKKEETPTEYKDRVLANDVPTEGSKD